MDSSPLFLELGVGCYLGLILETQPQWVGGYAQYYRHSPSGLVAMINTTDIARADWWL